MRWFLLMVASIAAIAAIYTLPTGRVSTSNLSLRDDATWTQKTQLAVGLAVCQQRIDDYVVVKFATIKTDGERPLVLIGLPFSGKYYKYAD